jgi:2-epi-5-epi-valiolone synthase
MSAYAADAAKAPHPAPLTPLGPLAVEERSETRVAAVRGLLDPANAQLWESLSGARRLLVVAVGDRAPQRLHDYLDAQCAAGRLDGYRTLTLSPFSGPPTLTQIEQLAEAALAAGVGRKDAFLLSGAGEAGDALLATAALLRRHSHAVQIVADLSSAAMAVRAAGRVRLAGGSSVRRRRSSVLIDVDALLTQPPHPQEVALLRELGAPDDLVPAAPAVRSRARESVLDTLVGMASTQTRHLKTYVGFTEKVFATEGSRLDDWLPEGGRLLAVVDDFSHQVLRDVQHWCATQRYRGRLTDSRVLPLTSGPALKSRRHLEALLAIAEDMRLGPADLILGIGGGTVLDLVGTVALLRGGATPYVRVPTTLVGMIDAGIGLKVGVDAVGRKNLLGGYHPAVACLCDPGFLHTLPRAELRCGLSEAIKIAAVTDDRLFSLLEAHHPELSDGRATPRTMGIISRAITAMLDELMANPYEEEVCRLPDFGHEFGHLVEAASRYRLRHGEAVAVGMAVSTRLAVEAGRLPAAEGERLLTLLTRVGLPVFDPMCAPDRLWRWLCKDISAHKGGAPHLVVPTRIGSGGFVHRAEDLSPAMMRAVCADLAERAR